ncbi:MAG: Holliday junction resolvase RuvX [Clostridia bacterium]|nr:Holliday junction resolvase RuvX [Clostridia bacterium]
MIIMSVDLGLARTGVAVSDGSLNFAFPKGVIYEKQEDLLVEKICDKAKEYSADRIVVGLPKNMDGTLGERAKTSERIAGKITELSNIQTVLFDERCTTISAHTYLDMNDVYGKKRKKTVDAVAATLILEDYLRSIKK